MNLTLEKVIRTNVEVELPDLCPHCQSPFTETAAGRTDQDLRIHPLVEEGWCGTSQPVRLGLFDDKWLVEDAGVSEDTVELSIRTGIRCGDCGLLLVSTEESNGKDEIARAPINASGSSADPWLALQAIRNVMFPDGDHEHECGSDELGTIANILIEAGL